METALTRARSDTLRHRDMLVKRGRSDIERVFYGANEFQMGTYPGRESLEGESALSHNRGEPYAATRPIAQRIAGQTVHVAEIVKAKPNGSSGKSYASPKSGRRRMSVEEMAAMPKWSRKKLGLPTGDDKGECVKAIKSMHSNAVRVDILESHPVMALLNSPNPRYGYHGLIELAVTSLQFTGKCFWWLSDVKKNRRDKEKKYDLWYVPTKRVKEKPGNILLDEGYLVYPENGEQQPVPVPAEKMIYFYYPDPDDPMTALAPMRACLQAVRVDESIAMCQQQTFDNGLFPALAFHTGEIMGPDGKKMGKIQYERWQLNELSTRLEQLMRGPAKHGKHIVLDRTIDKVEFLTNKPHEMDWLNSNEFNRDRIWRVVGTPRVVSGDVQDANRATALVADSAFTANTVNPKITMFSQVMNERLLPLYVEDDEDLIIWIEEAVSVDRDAKLKEIELMLSNRALTVNELRAELGKPPLPGKMGDVLVSTAMQVFEPITEDEGAGLEEREELLGNEDENAETVEVESTDDEKDLQSLESKSFKSAFHKDFATAWLKIHGKNERLFAAEVRKFLTLQAQGIMGKLKLALASGENPDAGDLFDPRAWDESLKSMARPNVVRAAFVGAVNAEMFNKGKLPDVKDAVDDVLATLPPNVIAAIKASVDETMSMGYWDDINTTTQTRLSNALKTSIQMGATPQQTTTAVRNALMGTPAQARSRAIARSETTNGLNSGAAAIIEDLKERGIATGSEWLAVLDEHTRTAHWNANGQKSVDGLFDIGGERARYPGDPNLSADQRVNCRCSLLSVLAGEET